MMGAATDFTKGEVENVHEEPWNTTYNGGDNNDGITILDITEPLDTHYCFVHWNTTDHWDQEFEGLGDDEEPPPKRDLDMTPLTGAEYASIYIESGMPEELCQNPLIDSNTLKEVWSEGEWSNREERGLPVGEKPTPPPPKIVKLADMAREKSIERLLDEDDALQEHIEELPNFNEALKKYLLLTSRSRNRPCIWFRHASTSAPRRQRARSSPLPRTQRRANPHSRRERTKLNRAFRHLLQQPLHSGAPLRHSEHPHHPHTLRLGQRKAPLHRPQTNLLDPKRAP
ncbi:hypothetical protein BU23DRAFT_203676 [Bimuria novae-zelandiae CBS 107.79]|uniref:Uncharacterized protein n=1 Tax=Bimuria novae-zelandiae CBS 107.79 TaxID=1447943 RepID=A0A6A5V1R3_9PLEO|nr:hypothetical protein BU23DRAFT_203676 [Bimuria novae-zelandiae CBS 107.79]